MTALATFKRAFQDAAHPLVAWMTTEGPDAVGLYNPWPELVAEMEAEGAALIGAKPCAGLHGVDNTMRNIEQGSPEMVYVGTCSDCGAVL